MQLVEQYAGVGSLRWREGTVGPIPYRIARYQGMATSGLPVPGVHRIETPAGVVSELIEAVGQGFLFNEGGILFSHPLHPFHHFASFQKA